MTYEKALEFIHGANGFSKKLGLQNMKTLCDFLGNPQDSLKFIHVAGTNGKGSTASFVNNILIAAGYQTGLFTSPFLEKFNERFQINNIPIEDDELASITSFVKAQIHSMMEANHPHPTEFEIVTAIGFLYFKSHQTDFVVLEVGLGGRLDATNIISSKEVSIITSIGFDHTHILGNTLSKIATEKAGILNSGGTCITYHQCEEIDSSIALVAKKQNNQIRFVKKDEITPKENFPTYQTFEYQDLGLFKIRLLGDHQILNATLSIEAALFLKSKGVRLLPSHIKEGLWQTFWPGRFEVVSKSPFILLDVSHNPAGVKTLISTLNKIYKNFKKEFVIGLLDDKDIDGILEILIPEASKIIPVTPHHPRGISAIALSEYILKKFPKILVELPKEELPDFSYEENVLTCICGSFYVVGDFRTRLLKKRS